MLDSLWFGAELFSANYRSQGVQRKEGLMCITFFKTSEAWTLSLKVWQGFGGKKKLKDVFVYLLG